MYTTGLIDSVMKKALKTLSVSQLYIRLSLLQKIGLGVIFLIALLAITKTYDSTTYAFFSYASTVRHSLAKDHFVPTFINIPSLTIALPIDETSINYGFWGMSQDGVSHLTTTSLPGEKGNIVIYGKNEKDKFGRLTSLQKGDEISVITQDGTTHIYTVTDLAIVSPTETSLIDDTATETLTLFTSYGFGDLKRFVRSRCTDSF